MTTPTTVDPAEAVTGGKLVFEVTPRELDLLLCDYDALENWYDLVNVLGFSQNDLRAIEGKRRWTSEMEAVFAFDVVVEFPGDLVAICRGFRRSNVEAL